MPFDPLLQFLFYPITNQEFCDGKTEQNSMHRYFNFPDSISLYQKQDYTNQLIYTVERIEKNGPNNALVFERIKHLKYEIENSLINVSVKSFNAAAINFNAAVEYYNKFIYYRNQQFLPAKPDADIQTMLDAAIDKLKESNANVSSVNAASENLKEMIEELRKQATETETKIKEQQEWLKLYFSKSGLDRKAMFFEKKKTIGRIWLNQQK